MILSAEEIAKIFIELKDETISREMASDLAQTYREEFDKKNLIFSPSSKEHEIWDAMQFIELFSEKIDRNTYLYSDSDLYKYMIDKGWL